MNRRFVAMIVLAIAGCQSKRHKALEALADDLNPLLVTMGPKMSALKALKPDAASMPREIYELCVASDRELRAMGAIELGGVLRAEDFDNRIALEGEQLISARRSCEDRLSDDPDACTWFCLDRWSYISDQFLRIRQAAESEGVAMYPVPVVPELR